MMAALHDVERNKIFRRVLHERVRVKESAAFEEIVANSLAKDNSENIDLLSSEDDILISSLMLSAELDKTTSFERRRAMTATETKSGTAPPARNAAKPASDEGIMGIIASVIDGAERPKGRYSVA